MKDFGVSRVMEPKGAVPATAWKLDNQRQISPKEIRIRLEKVHIEWDNFNQICSHCGYDEMRIKARIMQIIEERGKLHNPFTGSGGLFMGTIEEIGSEVDAEGLKVGDRVFSQSSITGMAMHIDRITRFDFNYGQMECQGYVICFEATSLIQYTGEVSEKYLLTAIDEEGNFLGVRQAVSEQKAERAVIIGGNLVTTLLYAQILRDCFGESTKVTAVLDKHSLGNLTEAEIISAFQPVIEHTCFTDLCQPLEAWKQIRDEGKNEQPIDAVINLEDISGSETLATLLVR